MRLARELALIYLAAFVRAFGIGLLGVVLGVYLFRIGQDSTRIGLVLASGLAGATVATIIVGFHGDRLGRRRVLFWHAILSSAGGIALGLCQSFLPLLGLAFLGMLNGMGSDRSAAFALEQAVIPGLVADSRRTWALSWYNVLLDTGGALGALAGGLPLMLQAWAGIEVLTAYRYMFFVYVALQLLTAALYLQLSPIVEVSGAALPGKATDAISHASKSIIRRLAMLFSVDAFGGGFLGDALVAYWFFRRFQIDERELGIIFFVVHLLNAASHLGAAWLAKRIGLVNTMVFTHLPSSILLIAAAFAPSPALAIALFLARESLVEMDVPTRQSYVAAVVKPHERTYASGMTNLTRTASWATASSCAGVLLQSFALSAPLIFGGGLKIAYDLLLYRNFRRLKPPEEKSVREKKDRANASM